jgi:aspartate ammonia-lyase
VNLEKIVTDIRLLSSGVTKNREIVIPEQQVGSSIMPGKVNPVIPEYIISSAHRIYANDLRVATLAAKGSLELNAYLPEIGCAMLESLKLMIAMNRTMKHKLLEGLSVNEEMAREKLFLSPSVTTALSPLIGYHRAAELAKHMKNSGLDVFEANQQLEIIQEQKLRKLMEPDKLLKKGFTVSDIREVL